MLSRISKFKYLFKLIIFIPVIFYFGKRSYIAFDEGFYALQARWILDKGNWTIPLWWNEYVLILFTLGNIENYADNWN